MLHHLRLTKEKVSRWSKDEIAEIRCSAVRHLDFESAVTAQNDDFKAGQFS